jgi:hypothetical protein
MIDSAEVEPEGEDFDLAKLPRNDTGNADRLVARVGKDLIYLDEAGWHWWCGQILDAAAGAEIARCRAPGAAVAIAIQREAEALKRDAKDFKDAMPAEPPPIKDGEDDPYAAERAKFNLLLRGAEAEAEAGRCASPLRHRQRQCRAHQRACWPWPSRSSGSGRRTWMRRRISSTPRAARSSWAILDRRRRVREREHRRGDLHHPYRRHRLRPGAYNGARVPGCPEWLRFLEWAQPDPTCAPSCSAGSAIA